jgi:ubiquinone/menaquinone biosynthesis C-methylase UbiE
LASEQGSSQAIDPGTAMIKLAEAALGASGARFFVSTFEDFAGEAGSFGPITSASAFHWVDPEVRWKKSHQLLRKAGWLALVDTSMHYEPYLRDALLQLWIEHSDDGGAFASSPLPSMQDQIRACALFGEPIVEQHTADAMMPADEVVALAQTSGSFLSYTEERKRSFVAKLRAAIKTPEVQVQRGASLVMAQASTVDLARRRAASPP